MMKMLNVMYAHHPFTSPKQEDISKLDSEPQNAQANAYDIVLNGYELGGINQNCRR